jgi:hypothetical protein
LSDAPSVFGGACAAQFFRILISLTRFVIDVSPPFDVVTIGAAAVSAKLSVISALISDR